MKTLLMLSLLALNSFAIDFNFINTTQNNTINEISDGVQEAFNSADLAPYESADKLSFIPAGLNPRQVIKEIMYALYIDDQVVKYSQLNTPEFKRLSKLLNYNNTTSRDSLRAQKIVEVELRKLTGSSLLLFSLESTGYGSFGEANGFAIYDGDNNELLLVQSGYAE